MIEYFFCITVPAGLDCFFNKEKTKQIKLRDEIKLQLQITKYQNNRAQLRSLHIFAKMLLESTSGMDLVLGIFMDIRDIKLLGELKKVRYSIQCHKYSSIWSGGLWALRCCPCIKKFKFSFCHIFKLNLSINSYNNSSSFWVSI